MIVSMDLALVVGSEIFRIDDVDAHDPMVRHAFESPPLDGAWILTIDEELVLDENLWDLVDVVLLDLAKALRRLGSGPGKASVVFPDTRATVHLERRADDSLLVSFDDIAHACPFEEFRAEAARVCGRLAATASEATGSLTGTWRALASFSESCAS